MTRALTTCAVLIAALAASAQAYGQAACKNEASATASVDLVTKTLPAPNAPLPQNNPSVEVALQDTIHLHVNGLAALLAELDCWRPTQPNKQLVLYLNGLAIKGLTGTLPRPAADGFISFRLARPNASTAPSDAKEAKDAKEAWNRVLSRPWPGSRTVAVSMGFADQYPIRSGSTVSFVTLPVGWFILGLVFVALVAYALIRLARETSLIRDGKGLDGQLLAYSLARTQMAWWFFFIVAGYLLIAFVTGEFNGALNETALTLLGIGAATAAGSAVVNASKQKEHDEAEQRVDAMPASDKKTLLQGMLKDKNEHFLTDILSDAEGISIHRFQMVVWTLVLTVIFAKEVYEKLAMPDFDANLLTLQGISAATYVGLKMAEPSVPKEAKT